MEAEIARTKRDLEQTELDLERAQSKLQNEGFITKAPPQVVDKEREKVESYRATAERLKSLLQEMQG
jgi:valyl-tRNA synthetase